MIGPLHADDYDTPSENGPPFTFSLEEDGFGDVIKSKFEVARVGGDDDTYVLKALVSKEGEIIIIGEIMCLEKHFSNREISLPVCQSCLYETHETFFDTHFFFVQKISQIHKKSYCFSQSSQFPCFLKKKNSSNF